MYHRALISFFYNAQGYILFASVAFTSELISSHPPPHKKFLTIDFRTDVPFSSVFRDFRTMVTVDSGPL